MRFTARLQAGSRTVIRARSALKPFVDINGIRFHWSGRHRTYIATQEIADPAPILHAPDVEVAATTTPAVPPEMLVPLPEPEPAPPDFPSPPPPPPEALVKKPSASRKK